ncbi:hypothetical protein [uncultured Mucilaginibacter sp.]|uniref:hypothetical protein n=1 Tax=uncultured Mucilaginibacter sp. TaxID=797541 RepID=UPI002601457E|nr:hypothetical protein [uncultured Mucilaginibacter sp.]
METKLWVLAGVTGILVLVVGYLLNAGIQSVIKRLDEVVNQLQKINVTNAILANEMDGMKKNYDEVVKKVEWHHEEIISIKQHLNIHKS